MGNVINMTYSSSVSRLCEINSSFDSGVLRVAYHGDNRNGSSISKQAFEDSISTIYNCPIVCNYNREEDEIGGHDVELVRKDDGSIKLVNVTEPVGVVPESAEYRWETVEEQDGSEHEYLCVDVLIWKRQEAYSKIKENKITSHSMEITVKDGEVVDGCFNINKFEFTALCLLGEGVEPCFESSALGVFSMDSIGDKMSEMISDLKNTFSSIYADTLNEDKNMEGGVGALEDKISLMSKYGVTAEDLEFSIDDMTIEELESALKEKFSSEPETGENSGSEDGKDFALSGNVENELRATLEKETVEMPWGEQRRYCMVDYDVESGMVYCYDVSDNWKLVGFNYTMNGDNTIIDYDSKKRMKFDIVEFDEGEQQSQIAAIFDGIQDAYTCTNKEWEEKFEDVSTKLDEATEELASLREFKAEYDKSVHESEIKSILDKFEDLTGIEEFDSISDNATDYSAEDLEEKCYAIRGKNMSNGMRFSKDQGTIKLAVEPTSRKDDETRPYGGLFEQYPPTI